MSEGAEPRAIVAGRFRFRHGDALTVAVPSFAVGRGDALSIGFDGAEEADHAGRVLLGLVAPDDGHVQLFGVEMAGAGADRLLALRRRLGFAPAFPAFLSTVPLKENVVIPLRDRRFPPEAELIAAADALLARLGTPLDARLLPQQASPTVRYVAGLARALLPHPELLIVADPPGALPAALAVRVAHELDEVVAAGSTAMIRLVSRAGGGGPGGGAHVQAVSEGDEAPDDRSARA